MPTVQKRATSGKTANRRRDRSREEEPEDVAEYEDEEESRPPRKSRVTRTRRERDQDDADDADDDEQSDDEQSDDDDDEETTEARAPRKRGAQTRHRRDVEADDERPRRNRAKAKATGEGIHHGWDGADQTMKRGGSGDWLKPDKKIQLIKFLEPEPLLSYAQHWIETEASQPGQPPQSRSYTCPEDDCPLCDMGDKPRPQTLFNVLLLSGNGQPKVQILGLSPTGYTNLKEVSADRKTGEPIIDRDFFAVQKTGAGTNTARVVFRPVKERDLEDDWDEIFDQFDPDDLPDIIEDAQGLLFEQNYVQPTPRRELDKLVKYLNSKED